MKHSKKACFLGNSHICRFEKNLFNNSIIEGKAHLNSFSGATINRLDHFITPILKEDWLDIVIIHVGSNDVTHNAINNIDARGISKRIIDIEKKCAVWCKRSDYFLNIYQKTVQTYLDHQASQWSLTQWMHQ